MISRIFLLICLFVSVFASDEKLQDGIALDQSMNSINQENPGVSQTISSEEIAKAAQAATEVPKEEYTLESFKSQSVFFLIYYFLYQKLIRRHNM
jgi:hypothetical protein